MEENPQIAKTITTKGLRAAEAREAARKARDLARDKNKVGSGGLPEKLRDCRNHDLAVSELYLVEGDSAGGSADTGRDAGTQAILPLRGKILNVEKAQLVKVLGNTEVASIFKAVGISPVADEQDIARRRYGKIILMTDADIDGSHIRTLLLTFIFRHMRELVKQGCVYVAQPPLYRVLQKSRRNQKPRYVQTHDEMMHELLALGLEGSTLVIKSRPDRRDEGTNGHPHQLAGETLRKLAELLGTMEQPLAALERRGLELRSISRHATPEGLLPRYRVFLGSEEHWFLAKADLDAFRTAEEEKAGHELSVADEAAIRTPREETAIESVPQPGTAARALQLTDLHEVRAINDGLRRLRAEFGLTLTDLLAAGVVNAEQVFPYEIENEAGPRRLTTVRDLVPALRDIGGRGLIYTSMDPEHRILKKVALEDAAAAEEIFRVLMGDQVEPRREFIEKHALEVTDLDI
jgi:DNA gyrase subunit B